MFAERELERASSVPNMMYQASESSELNVLPMSVRSAEVLLGFFPRLPLLLPGCEVVGGLAFTCDSPDDTWLTFIESDTVNVSRKKRGREGTLHGIYYCEPFIPKAKVPNRVEGFNNMDFLVKRTWNK
ncbi:unnamed protein product [Arctia plantaginis]|uniref:Uncharacterized protein n=1 Tax=Arctia plantaginis TaxID=874455 RepID=A0A8S1BG60_ARCPL|nr:unnamed protein product [Arctia plantaginis]